MQQETSSPAVGETAAGQAPERHAGVLAAGAEAFLHYLAFSRNLSTHTVRAYRTDLQDFQTPLAYQAHRR